VRGVSPRNRIAATAPSTMKRASTTACATTNGGSVYFGAIAFSAGTLRKACTTPTKTLR
jgi:hypothetical protein